jgi:type IV secretion system protein VirB2
MHAKNNRLTHLALLIAVALAARPAAAASAGMPWEGPLQRIVNSLTGPVAKGIGIIAIVVAGLGLAFGEGGGGTRKLIGIVFGLAVAFTAGSFGVSLLGFSGGFAP